MSLTPFTEAERAEYERQVAEGHRAFAGFVAYRDQSPGTRSLREAARLTGKSQKLMQSWSAEYNWVARAVAWDREQDRVARQARLDEIKRINKRHGDLAEQMLDHVAAYLPSAAAALPRSPHAVAEWVKTATKVQRDALGIAEPASRTFAPGEPEAPVQHDIAGIMGHLPPELVLKARDLAIEVAKVRAREAAGLPPVALPPAGLDG